MESVFTSDFVEAVSAAPIPVLAFAPASTVFAVGVGDGASAALGVTLLFGAGAEAGAAAGEPAFGATPLLGAGAVLPEGVEGNAADGMTPGAGP
ncbi:MAG: hypothetical protein HQM09_16850 [Candidatus Riflebacteria bacterium]|nr:hypothetical protein [Candidatus Riflebacteria bacterium]